MADLRRHAANLVTVLAEAAERAGPLLRAISEDLMPAKSAPNTQTRARSRATPRPTVNFTQLDAARADRALRRAGYRESDK